MLRVLVKCQVKSEVPIFNKMHSPKSCFNELGKLLSGYLLCLTKVRYFGMIFGSFNF